MRKFLQVVAVAVVAVSLGVAVGGCTQSASRNKTEADTMKTMETKMESKDGKKEMNVNGKMETKMEGTMETKMNGELKMEPKKDGKMETK
jgi:outer membrane lipoprotein-sorting protein